MLCRNMTPVTMADSLPADYLEIVLTLSTWACLEMKELSYLFGSCLGVWTTLVDNSLHHTCRFGRQDKAVPRLAHQCHSLVLLSCLN